MISLNVVTLLRDGETSLLRASYYGHDKLVNLLLKNGANLHAKNDDALGWAAKNGHTPVVDLLLKHGANVHAEDDRAGL